MFLFFSKHNKSIITLFFLFCLSFEWAQSLHADPLNTYNNTIPSPPITTPTHPPKFIVTYRWDHTQPPGVFCRNVVPTDNGQQTWMGIPSVITATQGTLSQTDKQPSPTSVPLIDTKQSVLMPTHPPVITYNLSSDGVLTRQE